MRYVALDIETEPNESLIDELPLPEIKLGNTRDEEKIEAKKAEAREAQLARMALSPDFGRVISIQYAYMNAGGELRAESVVRAPGVSEAEIRKYESELLQAAAELVSSAWQKETCIATFNGAGFDVPFLTRRALHLGICFPKIPIRKYEVCKMQAARHVDLYRVIEENEPGNPLNLPRKLAWYAKIILGAHHPEAFQNKLAYKDWYRQGNIGALVEAGKWDAIQTLRLAEVFEAYYE